MDLTTMTYMELFVLYNKIGLEMARRGWWVVILLILGVVIFNLISNLSK